MNPRDHKPELKVGDKIRIYDASSFNCPMLGTVTAVYGNTLDAKTFTAGNWNGYYQQVRRLRKKEKPAEERVAFTIHFDSHGYQTTAVTAPIDKGRANTSMRLVELRSGEAIVSRSSLAAAWDAADSAPGCSMLAEFSPFFKALCKALGLGDQK